MKTQSLLANIKEDFVSLPLYILSRPFKGFYEMKHLQRGKTYFAWVMMALICVAALAQETFTGFVVSRVYEQDSIISVPYVLLMTLAPILLFIAGNWSITAITDGKGRAKEIFQVYAYASYPKIILTFIGIVVSNYVTKEESAFALFFFYSGTALFLLYLFVGLVVIHEYTFMRSLAMVVETILAMFLIIFVLALFVSLLNELFTFIFDIAYEIRMKM